MLLKILTITVLSINLFAQSYDDFKYRCEDINIIVKDKIKDYKNTSEAKKLTKIDAITEITKQFYGVVVNSFDSNLWEEKIVDDNFNSKEKNTFFSSLASKGLVFYNFTTYEDEDGDMLDYKIKNGIIKRKVKLKCDKYTYKKIENFILEQELK